MDRRYFPKCDVDGPIEPPVPFAHMCSRGAVPNKCGSCKNLFEGECLRDIEGSGYKHLDYGPCGVEGPTDPVYYEDEFIAAKRRVPRKCASCHYLRVKSVHGFICTKDADKWGDCDRGLDWGEWEPDVIYRKLKRPKGTTDVMRRLAKAGDMLGFIREHRRVNPGVAVKEAVSDYHYLVGSADGVAES